MEVGSNLGQNGPVTVHAAPSKTIVRGARGAIALGLAFAACLSSLVFAGACRTYDDFAPGRPLRGGVITRSGRRIAGRIVYDLDESETTDTLGAGRQLPPVDVGDLLMVCDAGAYGSVMASNYNRRPTAAEVLVDDGQPRIIRRRQTVEELLQWDV